MMQAIAVRGRIVPGLALAAATIILLWGCGKNQPTVEDVTPGIQNVIDQYFRALNNRDEAAYLEMFHPQAEGLENHRKTLKNMMKQFKDFSYQVKQSTIEEVQENRATVRVEVQMSLTSGGRADLYLQEIVFYLTKYEKRWTISHFQKGVPRKTLG